jgi:hypothetical protein
VTALSADWVLPVDGPPLRNAQIAWEDGRIVAVGPGRADRHLEGAAILPGFVNAHSHLEYAVYAGFGDGLLFPQWLALHIERKARLDVEDMEAVARLGAAECLASGITTVGDLSYSGAAATACAELGRSPTRGLRPGADRGDASRRTATALPARRPAAWISPHTPYTALLDLWHAAAALGLPTARTSPKAKPKSPGPARTRPDRRNPGDVDPRASRLRAASDRIRPAHCVHSRRGARPSPRTRRRRPLPEVECAARLRRLARFTADPQLGTDHPLDPVVRLLTSCAPQFHRARASVDLMP